MPRVGSRRPGRPLGLREAVGKSAALAITSPVERISGPSTGSAPGKRANGRTAALRDVTPAGGASGGSSSSRETRARGHAGTRRRRG